MPLDPSSFVPPASDLTDAVREADRALVEARRRLSEARSRPPGRRLRAVDAHKLDPALAALVSAYNDALDEHSRLASQIAVLRSRIAQHPDYERSIVAFDRKADVAPLERAVAGAFRDRYLAVRNALDAGITKNQLGREVGRDVNWARRVLARRPASLGDDPDAPPDVSSDPTAEEF